MERNGGERTSNVTVNGDQSHPDNRDLLPSSSSSSILRSTLFLDNAGQDKSTCLGISLVLQVATEIKFSDVYGLEFNNRGSIHVRKRFLGQDSSEMYRFTVHGVQKSQSQPCLWALTSYTFGHKDLQTCQIWIDQINASLNIDVGRPKNLLVFVNPMSGKGQGCRTWETVAPIFSRAKVETKVIVTKRQGQAFDVMASISHRELNSYNGVVAVGGDGFFNEILNGFLLSRHKAPLPPSPSHFSQYSGSKDSVLVHNPNEKIAETAHKNEDHSPLLDSVHTGFGLPINGTEDGPCNTEDQELEFSLLTERLRFGIIPAGSTDAIVMCTTGTRDPLTSALHIVLGKHVRLDLAQVVRWKMTATSDTEPCVRYVASFAGYGFYGDVITESEKYRWIGPRRYDYAGTKVFLMHRSYEAEVAYVETESEKTSPTIEKGHLLGRIKAALGPDKSERVICRMNCSVCNTKPVHALMRSPRSKPYSSPEHRWLKCKGNFLSVGAAVISNRNEKAPDGLVADAHLSDGFLHLLLVRDCPRASYLWHLTQLARKGGKPLNFEFVEHHKTPAFTFTSIGNESVWNLDGEPFVAHQLSAQVCRGLVSLFASGPEV
uniref:DAGKc domain-containing protein n=1 Tax=Rhizophora mucronata TaxID=61149 RepID=A0A2P2KQQ6_RHIMU